jgi:hypothetical protein
MGEDDDVDQKFDSFLVDFPSEEDDIVYLQLSQYYFFSSKTQANKMSNKMWHQDNFSNGVACFIVVIKSKLKERTSEENITLVDYVFILIQSARTEEEIKKKLEASLHDQNGPFVSWLFDHIASHMHHYTYAQLKIQFVYQRNIFSEKRKKYDKTESGINAKFLKGSLVGSAKHTQ